MSSATPTTIRIELSPKNRPPPPTLLKKITPAQQVIGIVNEQLVEILGVDEELEDGGVPIADRIGLLDSAWRLLPDVARQDAPAATRLKAELQALVGPTGPSKELLEEWCERFPPPRRARRAKRKGVPKKKRKARADAPKAPASSES